MQRPPDSYFHSATPKKGFFRKYGLNVTLNREASWATSRDGLIFGRLDASPVVSGAVTNARIGAEGTPRPLVCSHDYPSVTP
ncbi:ABC transporter substrate-binding protein [Nostoc sp.]|uniref:ABC transporter substrate-binding protein n=1 Tax=Nostoc sp. TaxID=1180 RepID=UPI002FF57280